MNYPITIDLDSSLKFNIESSKHLEMLFRTLCPKDFDLLCITKQSHYSNQARFRLVNEKILLIFKRITEYSWNEYVDLEIPDNSDSIEYLGEYL
jgi:hypothetical protein